MLEEKVGSRNIVGMEGTDAIRVVTSAVILVNGGSKRKAVDYR
jgi:hypothetical protein